MFVWLYSIQPLVAVVSNGEAKRVMAREVIEGSDDIMWQGLHLYYVVIQKTWTEFMWLRSGVNHGVVLEYPSCFVRVSFELC
jgi:hypothetical protein